MSAPAIQTVRDEAGAWRWSILSDAGRPLVSDPTPHPTSIAAADAAKAWHAAAVRTFRKVDHYVS